VNRGLYARLAELERIRKTAVLANRSSPWMDWSAIEELREALRAHGFEQRETEGLAGTFARFLGITTQELKGHLQGIANGHSQKVAPER
jgi:hypothetical protein